MRWFQRFKKRANLHHVSVSGKAASADEVTAKKFPINLKETIDAGNYAPQQIFNVDETGLFWKKCPRKRVLAVKKRRCQGLAAKNRLTLMLGGNASGDFKLKPQLVYRAENPRALKSIKKSCLPVIWKPNKKAWVALAAFESWFFHHFINEVKLYCRENILDDAPGYLPHLDDFHPDVKVLYLPPNKLHSFSRWIKILLPILRNITFVVSTGNY